MYIHFSQPKTFSTSQLLNLSTIRYYELFTNDVSDWCFFCLFFRQNMTFCWLRGVTRFLTFADQGGRGGLPPPLFGWRHMWTAPYNYGYIDKKCNLALCTFKFLNEKVNRDGYLVIWYVARCWGWFWRSCPRIPKLLDTSR